MLALGIGANSTIFSWVNSVLLDPMPGSARTQELVQFTYLYKGDVMPSFSYPDYQDISRAAKTVTGITGFDDLSVGIVVDRDAERAWAEIVTANFFDVVGAPGAARPRLLAAGRDRRQRAAAVVLSHAYWQRRFNGDPSVIGRQIKINSQPFTIVGVAAEGFHRRGVGTVVRPVAADRARSRPSCRAAAGSKARAADGSAWSAGSHPVRPREQARAELDSTIATMRTTWASQNRYIDLQAAVFPLDNSPDGGISVLRPVLLILMAVGGVVLLITCANLAGLLLARASARQREIAIRLSMGAGRWRIVQQLLIEGIVLAGLGSIAALVALQWTSGLLIGFAPPSELPIHLDVAVDARVIWFTAAIAIGTVLLFALAPAAQAAPADVATTLRDVGRGRAASSAVTACAARSWPRRSRCRSRCWSAPGSASAASAPRRSMTPGFQAEGVVVGWLDLFSAGYTAAAGPRLLRTRARSRPRHSRRRVGVAQPAHSARLHRRQLHRRHRRGPHRQRRRSAGRRPQQRRPRLRQRRCAFRSSADATCPRR